MPLVYKSYGCQFKCGFKHNSNRDSIVRHEHQCWYNPLTKSCLTCKHAELYRGGWDEESGPEPFYRSCLADESIEFDGIKPKTFCKRWEGNNECTTP